MRIVFMGTPDFGVPTLKALVHSGEDVVAVVTQPDKPAGRGGRTVCPPVKSAALALGLSVLQPVRLREQSVIEALRALTPDVIVVAAFGQILPREVLATPRFGCLNVHASLLPRHRGAAPISAAILAGDTETGITIMLMEPGLDTGPILAQRREAILVGDTAESLGKRLAEVGAELLVETLPRWVAGDLQPGRQDERAATYAPVLRREQGHVDWTQPAKQIARACKAYYPWPGCYAYWNGKLLKILAAHGIDSWSGSEAPGQVVKGTEAVPLIVVTGQGALEVERLQVEGKRPMDAEEFLNGHRDILAAVLR